MFESRATFDVTVDAITPLATGVLAFELVASQAAPLPSWSPGAHIDVVMPNALERQYSLCGDPAEQRRWRVAVRLDENSRGGSQWLHRHARVGDTLRTRAPRNNFELIDASEYLFIAGGIGVTPFLPMLREATARGRPWHMIYGGRDRAAMPFLDELTAYGDAIEVYPQDERGLLPVDALLADRRAGRLVYCCGPEPLVTAVEAGCATWPPGMLRVERFTARATDSTRSDDAFDVVVQSTGDVVTIGSDESIVQALRNVGIDIPTSCEDGVCGTCEVGVLEGTPVHRDAYLQPHERATNSVIMPCCSRAAGGRLVLDL
jgi:ferredoxin-NADP reductase